MLPVGDQEETRLLSATSTNNGNGGDMEDEYTELFELLAWHKDAFEAERIQAYVAVMQRRTVCGDNTGAVSGTVRNQDQVSSWLFDMVVKIRKCQDEALAVWVRAIKQNDWPSVRQKHLEALDCFWGNEGLTVQKFEDMMFTLGPNIIQLINAMCLKLPADIMRVRKLQKRGSGGGLSIRIQSVGNPTKRWDEGLSILNLAADAIAPKDLKDLNEGLGAVVGRLLGSNVKEKVEVYMCGHKFYDSLGHTPDNENLLMIALLLVQAPGSTDNIALMNSPFGQSVAATCWELAFPQFVWQRAMEFLNIVFLCWYGTPICHSTHSDEPRWMEKWKVLLVFYFSMRGLFNICIELTSMAMILFGKRTQEEGRRLFTLSLLFVAYVNLFTLISVLVEVLTSYFGFRLVEDFYAPPGAQYIHGFPGKVKEFIQGFWDPCDYPVDLVKEHIVDTMMYTRPVSFAMIIFSKWCIFMMTLLNFDKLSKTALPAWHAIRSTESIWFLVYLMMLTFGCMLAYYALPVPDLGGDHSGGILDGWALAFTRISRLTLMGDFDMWALEGVDDQIKLPSTLRNASIEIVNGETVKEMHKALRFWVLLLALVFPVVLLNVYVGIIGKVYEEAKEANIAIAAGFRIVSSFRLLLHRRFWKHCFCGCFTLDWIPRCFSNDLTQMTEETQSSGDCYAAFIRVPRDLLKPEDEQSKSQVRE